MHTQLQVTHEELDSLVARKAQALVDGRDPSIERMAHQILVEEQSCVRLSI